MQNSDELSFQLNKSIYYVYYFDILNTKSYFNYIPMYIGDLFTEDILNINSTPINY